VIKYNNFMKKFLVILVLGLFIAYYLFGLNGLAVIFWAIALCVGYGLLLAGMRIWQKREIRKYHKKHKTIPKTYEDLEKHLKNSISVMSHLKKKLTLPNVTLLAVTSVEIEEHQMSLKISSQNIEFGAVKFLSSSLPEKKYSDIEYVSVKPMDMYDQNRFMVDDLHKYFETSHCLYVEAHSFVVNADLWKEEFLKFDYIGSPFPNKIQMDPKLNRVLSSIFIGSPGFPGPIPVLNMKENRVGSGGFSLRSRKLLKTIAKTSYDSFKFPIKNEDLMICHYLYKEMIDKGIRFAPPKLAAQFAMEWDALHLYGQDVNSVFGFHAKHMRNYFLKEYMRRASIGKW